MQDRKFKDLDYDQQVSCFEKYYYGRDEALTRQRQVQPQAQRLVN